MEIIKLSFIFGLNDIRQKYRRSYLGPWWITIGTFILILTLSLIFSAVFREGAENYILFLSIGLVIWRFIESSIKDFCDCFSRESQILKQIDINKLFFIYRVLIRNLIILFHNFLIIILIIIYTANTFSLNFFLLPFGFLMIALFLFWTGCLLSILCARFKDFSEIISNLMQVLFYMTPIIWSVDLLGSRYIDFVVKINPFYHLIELIRGPILSSDYLISYLVIITINFFGLLFSNFIFTKYKDKLVYWV